LEKVKPGSALTNYRYPTLQSCVFQKQAVTSAICRKKPVLRVSAFVPDLTTAVFRAILFSFSNFTFSQRTFFHGTDRRLDQLD
jgi:hypothetical protein